jgi:hypothetical protein
MFVCADCLKNYEVTLHVDVNVKCVFAGNVGVDWVASKGT